MNAQNVFHWPSCTFQPLSRSWAGFLYRKFSDVLSSATFNSEIYSVLDEAFKKGGSNLES